MRRRLAVIGSDLKRSKKEMKKLPSSVKSLTLSKEKFARLHDIKISGKKQTKKELRKNLKRLNKEYTVATLDGMNTAVKILATNPNHEKIGRVKEGLEHIILNKEEMERIVTRYQKNPEDYANLKFLPNMIINTLDYYASNNLTPEEKEIAAALDKTSLIEFCHQILKREIKRYIRFGLEPDVAFHMAAIAPTAKIYRDTDYWYRPLIWKIYDLGAEFELDIDEIIKSICKIDKDDVITKKEFVFRFCLTFVLQKFSNRMTKFNEKQRDLHEAIVKYVLESINDMKYLRCREFFKKYIKLRKRSETINTDSKRVIKFIDHANSNSPYGMIKNVITELMDDDNTIEAYLS